MWPRSGTPNFSSNGQFASGAQAFFFLGGTSTPIDVYQEAAFAVKWPVPVVADQNGVFGGVFIPYGAFRYRILDQNGVLLSDFDNIDNTAPPASGGGIVVTADMVFQTGDAVWRPRIGIMSGFVRMNANTIGSATSGASELASSITQNLFLYLWNTYSNTLCPVSTGRGASAEADFTANKTIGILSMKGLGSAGLDDMGGVPAGILQAITTCTTNGTTVVTVVNAAGIAVGDSAIVNTISRGPIVSISGVTIVLTSAAAGSASGISFRSSRFADATIAANKAGVQNIPQTTDQMAVHNHTPSESAHSHSEQRAASGASFTLGGTPAFTFNDTINTGGAVTGLSITNSGSGNPMSLLQPTMLGTYYMKL